MKALILISRLTGVLAAAILCAVLLAAVVGYSVPRAQAASPSAAGSLCVPMGVVGNVIISRCEDEDTGVIFYANSAGYMLLGE